MSTFVFRTQNCLNMKKFFILAALALLPFFAKAQNLCPDSHHPHMIDLGLPSGTKWACCNVGASTPDGYGSFFAWGETQTKSTFNWSTYCWCNGSETTLTKYNNSSDYGTVDNKPQLDFSDDAARANWHGSWCMPTIAELEELKANCSYIWTTINGVKGGKFTSRSNGSSIFLPAAGWHNATSLNCRGEYGSYWSSSLKESLPNGARCLDFDSNGVYANSHYYRFHGHSVRPVVRN